MQGTIHAANRDGGMIAVTTTNGLSIFRNLKSDHFDCGDRVEWKSDEAMGNTPLENITQKFKTTVDFIQNNISSADLRRVLFEDR